MPTVIEERARASVLNPVFPLRSRSYRPALAPDSEREPDEDLPEGPPVRAIQRADEEAVTLAVERPASKETTEVFGEDAHTLDPDAWITFKGDLVEVIE